MVCTPWVLYSHISFRAQRHLAVSSMPAPWPAGQIIALQPLSCPPTLHLPLLWRLAWQLQVPRLTKCTRPHRAWQHAAAVPRVQPTELASCPCAREANVSFGPRAPTAAQGPLTWATALRTDRLTVSHRVQLHALWSDVSLCRRSKWALEPAPARSVDPWQPGGPQAAGCSVPVEHFKSCRSFLWQAPGSCGPAAPACSNSGHGAPGLENAQTLLKPISICSHGAMWGDGC